MKYIHGTTEFHIEEECVLSLANLTVCTEDMRLY